MYQDDGKPNTKSAAPETWGVVGGKQEGFPSTLPPIARNSSYGAPGLPLSESTVA